METDSAASDRGRDMFEPTTAYVGLGSNLGDRRQHLDEAVERLGACEPIDVLRISDVKETQPLGEASQPAYLNAVAELATTLAPDVLLQKLHAVEEALGRQRQARWQSRTIDLDLLLFGQQIVNAPNLVVPHPQMHLRSFVLEGLCQLNRRLVHPVLGEPVCELARRLGGADFVLDPGSPQLVSIAGLIGVGKTTLAGKLADVLGAELVLEPYDTNPFLAEVYAGKHELALDSQLYFLTRRAEQLDHGTLARGKVVLTDYVFEKELIYARRLLADKQLQLYERIYRQFVGTVTSPVLVIYLQDSPDACLERIHRRRRPYEQAIGVDFLEKLLSDYERLFADWCRCPVIRLQASGLGGDDERVTEHIAAQIRAYVAAGVSPVPCKTPR